MTSTSTSSSRTRRPHIPATQTRPSTGRQEQLLAAASHVFAEYGYVGATMELVAAQGDSTKQTLYARFASKENLYRDCIERETRIFQDWMFTVYDATATLGARARLHAGVVALFHYVEAHQSGFKVLLAGHEDTTRTGLGGGYIEDILIGRVGQDLRAHNQNRGIQLDYSADLMAAMIVGLATSSARQCILHGRNLKAAGELAAEAVLHLAQLEPTRIAQLD